jgi:hypothetical protein
MSIPSTPAAAEFKGSYPSLEDDVSVKVERVDEDLLGIVNGIEALDLGLHLVGLA